MIDKSTIREILERISERSVLVIGDIIADEYIFGNTYRLSREAPIPIIRFQSSEIKPGGAGNVAMNIAAMGGRCTIVGITGTDSYSTELLNIFKRNSIDSGGVVRDDIQTIVKTRVLAGDINTSMQQIFRLDRGISENYSSKAYNFVKEYILENFRRYDAIAISDYGEGLFSDHFLRWLLKTTRGMKVIADSRFKFRLFKGCFALTPNINEISQIYGKYIQDSNELRAAALKLKRITRSRSILLKQGRNGLSILNENLKITTFPPFGNVEVADVTGAGDTVLAAFTLAVSAGIPVNKAAFFANIAGGMKVQKRGTVPVSKRDILRGMNGRKV